MSLFLQLALSGLMVGGVYSLVALGFVMIYKASGILNLAQGEILVLGAFFCYSFSMQLHFPIWLSFVLTFCGSALLGLVVERLFLRPLTGQSVLAIVMMTIALSVFLRGLILVGWGGDIYAYRPFFPQGVIAFADVKVSQELLYSFVVSLSAMGLLILYFNRTKTGLDMRAVAEDHQIARSTGIRIESVFAMAWVIAAVVSAVGGVLTGSFAGLHIGLSQIGLKALPVVLLGGLDSLSGAVVAGLIIGVLENVAAGYLDPLIGVAGGGIKDAFPFIVMIFILAIRPYGLFGMKRIERI